MNNNPVEQQPVKETWSAQKFADYYNKLVEESGFALAPTIATLPTNHGTFELVAKLEVRKLEK